MLSGAVSVIELGNKTRLTMVVLSVDADPNPSPGQVIIYAQDDGTGKATLLVKFAAGEEAHVLAQQA